jgi:hypothetical protein
MPSTLKTPGVYIEEISKFPPSVAQVETAIPAFIGYTEIAKKDSEDDLLNEATRISSLLEYETYFGGALEETNFSINIVEDSGGKNISVIEPDKADKSDFLMYYAMQMYFANGGGPCYILSVKRYKDAANVDFDELNDGLTLLQKEDEPTLILFPDAVSLSSDSNFYSLYNNALTQCKDLQDRFVIIDTFTDDDDVEMNDPEGLRNLISSDAEEKKYGAVYYPYLKTILNYAIDETKVSIAHSGGTSPAPIAQASVDATLLKLTTLENATAGLITELTNASAAVDATSGGTADEDAVALVPAVITAVDEIIAHLNKTIVQAELVVDATRDAADAASNAGEATTANVAANALDSSITTKLREIIVSLEKEKDALSAGTTKVDLNDAGNQAFAEAGNINIQTDIIDLIDATITDAIEAIVTSGGSSGTLNTKTLADAESIDNEAYNAIKAELDKVRVDLPPSSAMAGIYARVDGDRGVWKAPANVSVKYVVKPTQKINNDLNGRLNIDTTAGKSINAIRSFTGKGVIVWGARTLAGNDNEWRYVSVRRFFNMVEESVKKATEQFVFEPNDANTWVKVKAMIENFLINQWKAGALAGSKAEDAFYVRVGLNQTMTAQEILEGVMNVEIGMAVVRPAEFIVLKFSHKMQES